MHTDNPNEEGNPHARMMERLRQEREDARAAKEAQKKAEAQAEAERKVAAFNAHVATFTDDFETVLTSQAQQLHGMFARAVDEFAGAVEEDKAKLYGAIALRAQNYCRMTLGAIHRGKERKLHATTGGKIQKIEEQPIIRSGNEALDTSGTQTPGGIDTAVATMENSGN